MEWTTKMEGGGSLYLRDEGNYLYLEATRPPGEGLYKVILQGLHGGQVLGTMSPEGKVLKLSRMVSRSTMGQWGCLPLTKVLCQLSFPFQEGKFYETGVESRRDSSRGLSSSESNAPTQGATVDSTLREVAQEEELFQEVEPVGESLEQGRQFLPSESFEEDISLEEQWEEVVTVEKTPDLGGFSPCAQPVTLLKDPVLQGGILGCQGVLSRQEGEGFSLAIPYFPDKAFPLTAIFCFGRCETLGEQKYVLYSFREGGSPWVEL